MEKKYLDMAKILLQIPAGSAVAIFPHVGVDADCLGSTLALKAALDALGETAQIITDEPVPDKFFFFPGVESILVLSSDEAPGDFIRRSFPSGNLLFGILVDCSNPGRIGDCARIYDESERKMVLDHHFTSSCVEELCIVDPHACASGQIVYSLIQALEHKSGEALFTKEIAVSIMAAVLGDTGGFRYSNTNKEAFGIASDLFTRFPFDLKYLTYHLFEKTSLSRLCLQGKAYAAARFHAGNRIAVCSIDQAMIDECGAMEGDVDGICSDLRNVEGVVAAFVLRERPNGEIRVNIRSSELFDSSSFAAGFGGGGHMRASGCTLTGMSLEEAAAVIAAKSEEILNSTITMKNHAG